MIIPDIDMRKFTISDRGELPNSESFNYGARISLYDISTIDNSEKYALTSQFNRLFEQGMHMDEGLEWCKKCNKYDKASFYPECLLGAVSKSNIGEIVKSFDGHKRFILLGTTIPKGLVNLDDSDEEINFWQYDYALQHAKLAIRKYISKWNLGFEESKFISTPIVTYDTDEKKIYNYVIRAAPDSEVVIPISFSRHGGCYVIRTKENQLLPAGTGRRMTRDEAYSALAHDDSFKLEYRDATRDLYAKTFFDASEAAELPCTAKAIIYVGAHIGALMCKQVKCITKGEPCYTSITVDHKNGITMYESSVIVPGKGNVKENG